MFEKIKKMFETKEKRVENLVSILIILIITLIVINKILDEDDMEENDYRNEIGVELAKTETNSIDLENRLEKILSKILGVGKVSVLLTYKDEGSINPIYNVNSTISMAEEMDSSGNSKTNKSESLQKEAIMKNDDEIILEKKIMPTLEGAIITATRSKKC